MTPPPGWAATLPLIRGRGIDRSVGPLETPPGVTCGRRSPVVGAAKCLGATGAHRHAADAAGPNEWDTLPTLIAPRRTRRLGWRRARRGR